jgi:hypothetical protein
VSAWIAPVTKEGVGCVNLKAAIARLGFPFDIHLQKSAFDTTGLTTRTLIHDGSIRWSLILRPQQILKRRRAQWRPAQHRLPTQGTRTTLQHLRAPLRTPPRRCGSHTLAQNGLDRQAHHAETRLARPDPGRVLATRGKLARTEH